MTVSVALLKGMMGLNVIPQDLMMVNVWQVSEVHTTALIILYT